MDSFAFDAFRETEVANVRIELLPVGVFDTSLANIHQCLLLVLYQSV